MPVPPPPVEVHDVLSVDDQVMSVLSPFAIEVDVAEMVTAGVGVLATVSVSPPDPHEVRPETDNSTAKRIPSRTLEPTTLLHGMIVSPQEILKSLPPLKFAQNNLTLPFCSGADDHHFKEHAGGQT